MRYPSRSSIMCAKAMEKSIIIGGENYGQGSSREHAAINPMYLGVKAVIAKSMARLHKGNLINHGVVPMLFDEPSEYDHLNQEDQLEICDFLNGIRSNKVTVKNLTTGRSFTCHLDLTSEETDVILAGGRLRYVKNQAE